MKKRILAMLLCGCMAGTLFVGCGSTGSSDSTESSADSESKESASDTETTETKEEVDVISELSSILGNAAVSVTVDFGTYEQDNDESNGTESIEWVVLKKKDDKVLVVSKYGLDCKPYNDTYEDVTWESCSLRSWLNSTFMDSAFTKEEQEYILETNVKASDNSAYNTDAGNKTKDKIFLLSNDEVEKYMTDDSLSQCAPTAYALAKGAYTNESDGNCWWWLRTPGYNEGFADYVKNDGTTSTDGDVVDQDEYVVRPAMWINLDF